MKYIVFQTKWGYFGLTGTEKEIYRSILPLEKAETVKSLLLKEFPDAEFDKNLFKNIQGQIIDYFEGKNVDFSTDIPVFLNGSGQFSHKILNTCRTITYGRTTTYADLAQKVHHPNAARAVGNVMAKNPIPLIIPCHRILRSDGKLGGFSAPGGTNLKKRLLLNEKQTL